MRRREFGRSLAAGALAGVLPPALEGRAAPSPPRRTRPGEALWPSPEDWAGLGRETNGALRPVAPPFQAALADPGGEACKALFSSLKNPYFISDEAGLTQTLGWVDAWTSRPSAFVVEARTAADISAAVRFAARHSLRLAVKGGGHSYLGGSNAGDSLLVWTRGMRAIEAHDAFLPRGGEGRREPVPAVSVQAGALWGPVYEAVVSGAGRYVQGGGCLSVGVAGLVQSGGFGSLSKGFGLAAGSLLEAEVVTADGALRVVNADREEDLFHALRGGGGGSFGVVTRLTLKTHPLPAFVGPARARIRAATPAAYRRLVAETLRFYRTSLLNPHWGEQIRFRGQSVAFDMMFQGLTQAEASAAFAPFLAFVRAAPEDYALEDVLIFALPARRFWDPGFLRRLPGVVRSDPRPGAPEGNIVWSGDAGQAGQVLHGYHSHWLDQALLEPPRVEALVDALVFAADVWSVSLHCNKGLAGAPDAAISDARATAVNPKALTAFALAIIAGEEGPAYPGVAGHEPDVGGARRDAGRMKAASDRLAGLLETPASYLAESDYFQSDWRAAFWGEGYGRLLATKRRYDPADLFIVHHGVGSERWSADGFTRLS